MIAYKLGLRVGIGAPLSLRTRMRAQSRGAVLVTGLLILAVMMVVGIASMRGTVLEERMAGNFKDQASAFQAAEAGLQAALTAIESLPLPPAHDQWYGGIDNGCRVTDRDSDTACTRLNAALADWRTSATPEAGSEMSVFDGVALSDANQPLVVVESRYSVPFDFEAAGQGRGIHYYTVSALGIGPSGQSETILQTTIGKVYAW